MQVKTLSDCREMLSRVVRAGLAIAPNGARAIQTRIPTLSTLSTKTDCLALKLQKRHNSNAPAPALSNFETDAIAESYDKPLAPLGDPSKRAFTYVVLGGARCAGPPNPCSVLFWESDSSTPPPRGW